jgi:hypothetical protein
MSDKVQVLPFFQRYLNGEVLAEDIDDFIDSWHENSDRKEIFEYLGMTKEEYSLWLHEPDSLPRIARARRIHLPVSKGLRDPVDD